MVLRDVHNDMERYLEYDCYCPGEIYDTSGFFFQVFKPEDECKEISRGADYRNTKDTVITVVCKDQLINFWVREDKITGAERYDATKNNIRIMPLAIAGKLSPEDKLDEFKPGETAKSLNEILSMVDAVLMS